MPCRMKPGFLLPLARQAGPYSPAAAAATPVMILQSQCPSHWLTVLVRLRLRFAGHWRACGTEDAEAFYRDSARLMTRQWPGSRRPDRCPGVTESSYYYVNWVAVTACQWANAEFLGNPGHVRQSESQAYGYYAFFFAYKKFTFAHNRFSTVFFSMNMSLSLRWQNRKI